MPKNPACVNGFTLFADSLRPFFQKQNRTISYLELNRFATPRWLALSDEEKDEWKLRARNHKSSIDYYDRKQHYARSVASLQRAAKCHDAKRKPRGLPKTIDEEFDDCDDGLDPFEMPGEVYGSAGVGRRGVETALCGGNLSVTTNGDFVWNIDKPADPCERRELVDKFGVPHSTSSVKIEDNDETECVRSERSALLTESVPDQFDTDNDDCESKNSADEQDEIVVIKKSNRRRHAQPEVICTPSEQPTKPKVVRIEYLSQTAVTNQKHRQCGYNNKYNSNKFDYKYCPIEYNRAPQPSHYEQSLRTSVQQTGIVEFVPTARKRYQQGATPRYYQNGYNHRSDANDVSRPPHDELSRLIYDDIADSEVQHQYASDIKYDVNTSRVTPVSKMTLHFFNSAVDFMADAAYDEQQCNYQQ